MRALDPARSYADRLELCSLIAAAHPHPTGIGDQRAGIVAQTKWQDRSGRALVDGGGRLATWWPLANWTLTVWQLAALQRRGEFADVAIADDMLPLDDAVAGDILEYYERLDAGRDDAFALQRALWRFHVRAIERGLVLAADKLAALPAAEARFAEAWGHGLVGLLAATNAPTDHDSIRGMQRLLPSRLVTDDDWKSSAVEPQQRVLVAIRALYDDERRTGGELAARLASNASTPDGAKAGASALWQALVFGGPDAAAHLRAGL
ncbi:MAG TPA: hypothetical protein VF334_22390 [Polyangia bacterium]